MNNVQTGAAQRQTVSSVSRIMHEIASSQKAPVQLPPWFAPFLRCHPPIINPSRPLRWQSVWLPFRGLSGRSCWGREGGGGRGSRREGRREPAAATAGGESGRARWSFLPPFLLFRSSLVASALVPPPSEVLTSVAFRRHRKTWLLRGEDDQRRPSTNRRWVDGAGRDAGLQPVRLSDHRSIIIPTALWSCVWPWSFYSDRGYFAFWKICRFLSDMSRQRRQEKSGLMGGWLHYLIK